MIGSGQSRCCCLLLWAWFGVVDEPVGQRVPHLTLIVYVLVASSLLSRLLHIHVRSCCCSLLVGQATLSCALSLPLTISRKLEALPGARPVLRSWPLTLDAMHILSGAMGPCPPATVTALSPTPLLHAVDLPKQASLSSPAATSHPSIHDISTLAWSVSSSACFSFGEGVSDLLGAGPACYDGHRPSPPCSRGSQSKPT